MKLPILQLTEEQRREIFTQISIEQSIPVQAAEKDWWVCLVLRAIFESAEAQHFIFKGGTSLSKGWGLIKRFSEDIDLAIDRKKWGYDEGISKNQIKKLREKSRAYVRTAIPEVIKAALADWGFPAEEVIIEAADKRDEAGKDINDTDPTEILIKYNSLFETHPYLKALVKVEVSARSMHEPVAACMIHSFVDEQYSGLSFAQRAFEVLTVKPTRTFLEKAILLHEGFCKPFSPDKAERKSRHLYDLVQLMDTDHGSSAVADNALFIKIVEHRVKFTKEKGVDYATLSRETINFIPPEGSIEFWHNDYQAMTRSMIQGETLPFDRLMEKLNELQRRFKMTV